MVYTLRFFSSSKCSLFHNCTVFGSCIIHILYTGCAKIQKNNNSGAKRLIINTYVSLMYGLRKNGKVFTSKSVGTGPSSYGKKNLLARGLTEVEKH